MFDHWTLKKRLTLTFAFVLLLAGALIGAALFNASRMRETVAWNTHTYKVLAEADQLLVHMLNIETGLRGFVAGGHDKFLEPVKTGEQGFQAAKEGLTQPHAVVGGQVGEHPAEAQPAQVLTEVPGPFEQP